MSIKFSNKEEAEKQVEEILKKEFTELNTPIPKLVDISQENVLEQLFNAVEIFTDKASFIKNIKITNKSEQKEKFLESRDRNEDFEPEFKFRDFQYNEKTFVMFLDVLTGECEKIGEDVMEQYGAEQIDLEEFRAIWEETFEELKLYVKLAGNIKNRDKWLNISRQIWPMAPEYVVEETRSRLEEGFDLEEEQKELQAEDLKPMWEEELERLGVDYEVEIRNVSGCFNIPEEQKVIIAKGEEEERYYSKEQAEMLTMHELFHVVRGYNGRKVCEESGLPPILGVHTPFYDQTEEGGALYREKVTETADPHQWKDYHVRFMAAYYLSEGMSFQEAAEKLIDLGSEPDRAFNLLMRNREVLRHHIYLNGYQKWKDLDERWPLLIGKIDHELAEILKKEVEAGGMLSKAPVTGEELFNFSFD
jgi:hypothetical protein